MRFTTRVVSAFRTVFRKETLDADLHAELQSVVGLLAQEKIRDGMPRQDAYRHARIEVGGVEKIKADVREQRVGVSLDSVLQDLRFTYRQFRRSPGFTAVAVLTLVLGIGANTAVFSVVNNVLLSPLPYADEDRITTIWNTHEEGQLGLSEMEFAEYAALDQAYSHMGVYVSGSLTLTGTGEAERLSAVFASSGVFSALGVDPILGRTYVSEEDHPAGERVVLISESLWERRFARDPSVVGRTLVMNGIARAVVGIIPRGFRVPGGFEQQPPDLVSPLRLDPSDPDPRNIHYLSGVGRMVEGVSPEQASAALAAAAARFKVRMGDRLPDSFSALAVPVREQVLGDVRPALLILLGAVLLVLLIACVNVANLLLARSDARAREMAVRTSLGARPSRLMRQLVTETSVLAVTGGVGGLVLGMLGARGLAALSPPGVPRLVDTSADLGVFAFCLVVTLVTCLVIGLIPALRLSRGQPVDSLRGSRGSVSGSTGVGMRRALVTVQVALAAVLSIGAGLLVRSFAELETVDLGFDETAQLTFQVSLPGGEYPDAGASRRFYDELRRELGALPGVEEIGGTTSLPLASSVGDWGVRIRGRGPDGLGEQGPGPDWMVVTEGYFEALRIPVLQGRTFRAGDLPETQQAVVIGDEFARRHWPQGDALGAQIRMTTDLDTLWRTVVGIVGNVRQTSPEVEPRPTMYMPHGQFPNSDPDANISQLTMVVRAGTSGVEELMPAIRAVVRNIDPDLALANVQTMSDVTRAATATRSFQSVLFGAFAGLALVLVVVGVYGVTAYLVSRRTRELGIRLALGASPGGVRAMVLREGLAMTGLGLVIGVGVALGLSRLLESLLYGITPRDPFTFVLVPAVLALTAVLSAAVPAARAARVDPIETLRQD